MEHDGSGPKLKQEPSKESISTTSSAQFPPLLDERSNSQSSLPKSTSSHRQSFAESLRTPPSPRQRHSSFTQQAIQDLVNHPPATNKHANPRFAHRDWREIALEELITHEDVHWVDWDTSVEDATKVLLKNNPRNVVLVRENATSKTAVSTFDYNDLNAYLLVVVGLAKPDEEQLDIYNTITTKAQSLTPVPLRDIQPICRKESLVTLNADDHLQKAMEVFGSGIHRVLVANRDSEVIGILSQLRLLTFFWDESVSFPAIERLYPATLRDLNVGSQHTIAISADAALSDALQLMSQEGLTSVAVVDNGHNVVGNISTVDVRHLTSAASMPLLKSSCMHFISVILTERGVEKGKDSFPVFYVNPYSTLAHTVAKLSATKSHRMWVVESASPHTSQPTTPLLAPVGGASSSTIVIPATNSTPQSPLLSSSVPASSMPGAHLSGRLTGVISLTDILNLFAKSSGLRPTDPGEQRARRRRSSSSSVRPSMDSSRASLDLRR